MNVSQMLAVMNARKKLRAQTTPTLKSENPVEKDPHHPHSHLVAMLIAEGAKRDEAVTAQIHSVSQAMCDAQKTPYTTLNHFAEANRRFRELCEKQARAANMSAAVKRMTTPQAQPSVAAPQAMLHRAAEMLATRGKERDSNGKGQERSMGATVAAFNAVEGTQLTERQGWAFMQTLKLVRAASTARNGRFNEDDYLDGAAYAALACESASSNKGSIT